VPIIGDLNSETNESFFITLSNAVNATLGRTQAVCTIVSDEGPGILDHFEWSTLSPTQLVNVPFAIAITARDILGNVVTTFSGSLAISGLQGSGVDTVRILTFTNFADVSTDGEYRHTLTAISTYFTNFQETATSATNAGVLQAQLAGKQVFLIPEQENGGNMGALGTAWSAMLNNFVNGGGTVIVCSFAGSEHLILANSGLLSVSKVGSPSSSALSRGIDHPLNEGVAYPFTGSFLGTFTTGNGLVIAQETSTGNAVVIARDVGAGHVVVVGTDFFTLGTGMDRIVANSVRLAQSGGFTPVPVLPTVTGLFTNGVWSGFLTVSQESTNMTLRATDTNSLRSAASSPFAVIVDPNLIGTNDLAVRVTATPDPAFAGQPLTYLVSVTNSGPADSSGVRLTNTLPATVPVLSILPSQGSCSNTAGVIVCDLGLLPGGANATVAITVVPQTGGFLTNSASLSRNEPDPVAANDTRTLVTAVLLPALSINDVSTTESNAGSHTVTFTVTLSQASTQRVTVAFATGNDSAVAGSDYSTRSGTLTFNAGVTTQALAISILGDTLYESDESFFVNLSAPVNATLARAQGLCTILNDDAPPSLTVSNATVLEGDAGTTTALFVVRLSATVGAAVSVDFFTSDGTATAGSDYVTNSGTVTFASGTSNLTQTISVAVNGDTLGEPTEFFFLNLTNAAGATLAVSQAVGTILSDEGPGILHHFEWSTPAPTQYVNAPFAVTLAAKDIFNDTLSGYTNRVALNGFINSGLSSSSILITEVNTDTPDYIEFMNVSSIPVSIGGWQIIAYDNVTWPSPLPTFVVPSGAVVPPGGVFRLVEFGATPGAYPDFFSGANISWVNSAAPDPIAVLLRDDAGKVIDFFCAVDAFPSQISSPIPIPTSEWSGNPDPANLVSTLTFQRVGNIDGNSATNWTVGTPSPGLANSGLNLPFSGASTPVAISPTSSATFTNGVWTGNVTVLQGATNLTLRAADAANHLGDAGPLIVLPAVSDLALTLSDSPDPVAVSNSLTYTISVLNRGPSLATAFTVTDKLPPAVLFVSAVSSHGSCANVGGTVTCNLTNLPSGSRATVTVVVTPRQAGTLTNTATAAVSGATDPLAQNNSATAITTVFSDRDHDGMPDQWEVDNGLNPDDASDAPQDPDGDGMTNLQEYQAGTNPHDAGSVLRITHVEMVGREMHIFFTGVSGKRYRIERQVEGTPPTWVGVLDIAAGATTELEVIDVLPAGEATRIYRVRLLTP
jgi:uncharacterized repeat protein (TIGR01451 family)